MTHRLRDREEGQIIPALLLFVVVIVFFGLAFAQVGSAAEKKTQTQTAADAAAVTGAHQLRDFVLGSTAALIPTQLHWVQTFNGVIVPRTDPVGPCNAAQRNWDSNPHRNNARIPCSDVSVLTDFRAVRVDLQGPRDQVVTGPVEGSDNGTRVEDLRPRAGATARVSMSHCPRGVFGIQKAVADFLADQTLIAMRAIGGGRQCLTAGEAVQLAALETNPVAAAAAAVQLGPYQPIVNSVRSGLYAELVD